MLRRNQAGGVYHKAVAQCYGFFDWRWTGMFGMSGGEVLVLVNFGLAVALNVAIAALLLRFGRRGG